MSERSNTKVVPAVAGICTSCSPFIVYAKDDPRSYFECVRDLLSTPTLYSSSKSDVGAGAGAGACAGAGGAVAGACAGAGGAVAGACAVAGAGAVSGAGAGGAGCGANLGGQSNPHGLPFCPVLALLLNALLAAAFVLPTPAPTTYLFSIVVYDIPGNLNRLTPPPLGFVIGVPATYLLPEPLGPNFGTCN